MVVSSLKGRRKECENLDFRDSTVPLDFRVFCYGVSEMCEIALLEVR